MATLKAGVSRTFFPSGSGGSSSGSGGFLSGLGNVGSSIFGGLTSLGSLFANGNPAQRSQFGTGGSGAGSFPNINIPQIQNRLNPTQANTSINQSPFQVGQFNPGQLSIDPFTLLQMTRGKKSFQQLIQEAFQHGFQ